MKRLRTLYQNFPLSEELLGVLRRGMKIAVHRITPYLYGGREWEKAIAIYLDVKETFNRRRTKTLRTLGLS